MRYDHYEVMHDEHGQPLLLGRGGMGETYRARDTTLGREVALKIVHPHLLADPGVRARFLREARATARLHHRNIATVHHQGQTGDTCYYAMEFIPGVTLQQVLKEKGTLPVAAALALTRQVVQGLAEAEKHGLIHRDIKPANIMLVTEADGHELVKLIDFGLAKFAEGSPGEAEVTRQGSYLGTATTSSPEQCAGEDLDSRSDFYSLGVTLWHMVEGHPPFSDPNAMKVMMAHLQETPPFRRLSALPAPLVKLIRRLLEKDRARRPANTAELMRLLDECASATAGTRVATPAPATPYRPGPDDETRMTEAPPDTVPAAPASRSSQALAALVLLLVAGAAGIAIWLRTRPGRDPAAVTQPAPSVIPATVPAPPVADVPPAPPTPDELRAQALAALGTEEPAVALRRLSAWSAAAPADAGAGLAELRAAVRKDLLTRENDWNLGLAGSAESRDLAAGLASNRVPELWVALGRAALVIEDRAGAEIRFTRALDPAANLPLEWAATASVSLALAKRGRPDGPAALAEWGARLAAWSSTDPAALGGWVASGRLADVESVAAFHPETLKFLAGAPPGVPPERVSHWRRESVARAERAGDWPGAVDLALAWWKAAPASPEGEWALGRLNQWIGQWLVAGAPAALGDPAAVNARVDGLAAEGIPAAMEWAGKRRITSDPAAARAWFERAARAGSATAAAQFGLMCLNGAGGAADPGLAGQWLRQSRDRGNEAGMLLLASALLEGALPEESAGEAVATLRRAAELGNGRAMDRLGDCHRRGAGVAADPARALAWFEDAIEAGHWQSLGNKGVMHMLGEGGPVDKALAVSLFRQGAEKENAWCMFLLGQSLWAGEGVPADRGQALDWLRKSAAAGQPEAAEFLRAQAP